MRGSFARSVVASALAAAGLVAVAAVRGTGGRRRRRRRAERRCSSSIDTAALRSVGAYGATTPGRPDARRARRRRRALREGVRRGAAHAAVPRDAHDRPLPAAPRRAPQRHLPARGRAGRRSPSASATRASRPAPWSARSCSTRASASTRASTTTTTTSAPEQRHRDGLPRAPRRRGDRRGAPLARGVRAALLPVRALLRPPRRLHAAARVRRALPGPSLRGRDRVGGRRPRAAPRRASRARGRLERTVVAVTADHGESLGEHGERTHSYTLYDATLSVPVVLLRARACPTGRTRARRGVDRLASVAPTLARGSPGLAPLAREPTARISSPAPRLRRGAAEARRTPRPSPPSSTTAGRRSTRSAPPRHHYVRAPRPELYDVRGGSARASGTCCRRPAPGGGRARRRDRRASRAGRRRCARRSLDAETKEQLRALGYALPDGARGGDGPRPEGRPASRRGLRRRAHRLLRRRPREGRAPRPRAPRREPRQRPDPHAALEHRAAPRRPAPGPRRGRARRAADALLGRLPQRDRRPAPRARRPRPAPWRPTTRHSPSTPSSPRPTRAHVARAPSRRTRPSPRPQADARPRDPPRGLRAPPARGPGLRSPRRRRAAPSRPTATTLRLDPGSEAAHMGVAIQLARLGEDAEAERQLAAAGPYASEPNLPQPPRHRLRRARREPARRGAVPRGARRPPRAPERAPQPRASAAHHGTRCGSGSARSGGSGPERVALARRVGAADELDPRGGFEPPLAGSEPAVLPLDDRGAESTREIVPARPRTSTGRARASAASRRRRVALLPSTRSVSKMRGEAALPVTATRTGCASLPSGSSPWARAHGLELALEGRPRVQSPSAARRSPERRERAGDRRRQCLRDRRFVEGDVLARGRSARARRARAACGCARAAGRRAARAPASPRRGRPPTSSRKGAAASSRRVRAAASSASAGSARGACPRPPAPRSARPRRGRRARTISSAREDLLVAVGPAEAHQPVAHRLGQVAGLPEVLDGHRVAPLRELLAVRGDERAARGRSAGGVASSAA